jgi:hypothetical protein
MTDREPARWLSPAAAAAYLDLPESSFLRKVRNGVFPKPSYAAGKRSPRWDKHILDVSMSGGIDSIDARTAFEALANEITTEGAKRRTSDPAKAQRR